MRSRLHLARLGFAAAALCASAAASAHLPVFITEPHPDPARALRLPDIQISRAFYAEVPCPNRPLWMTFKAERGDELFVQLGLPVMQELRDFRPSLALLGPGLPPAKGLPIAAPGNLGARVFSTREVAEPRPFHEPYSDTDSWILLEETITLPSPGQYYLIVWSEQDRRARLWVATGTEERIEPADVARALPRVKAFHDPATAPGIGAACR